MKKNEGIRLRGKTGRKNVAAKKEIKFGNKSVAGHFSGCASFDNGKRANPICGMAKLRSPVFVMAESPFSRKTMTQVDWEADDEQDRPFFHACPILSCTYLCSVSVEVLIPRPIHSIP